MPYREPRRPLTAVFLLACLSACSATPDAQRWEVLMMGIPEEVATSRAPETSTFYVLKQTHEPLFRRDDGQNYGSRVLVGWSRDLTAREYTFCPDTSLRFYGKTAFDLKYFLEYLETVTGRYCREHKIEKENGCARVTFPVPRKGYLDALTLYENAPSVRQAPGIEAGLGPFFVEALSKDRITLARKEKVKNGYNEIIIREYTPAKGSEYAYRDISDFNKLMSFDVPEDAKTRYLGFNNIQLRSNVLIINHPDREVRRRVYNCLDVDGFRRAFLPQSGEFYDLASILPVGIVGAVSGKPAQVCRKDAALTGKKVVLYNHRPGNRERLEKFAGEFKSRSGLSLEIVYCTPQELVRVLHKYPRPFNLAVLALDTVYPEYLTFFDCFIRRDGYLDFRLPKLERLFSELEREDDPEKKVRLAGELQAGLAEEAVVLPLSQDIKKFFYPKKIRNLLVGRGFMEYPEVADFRW